MKRIRVKKGIRLQEVSRGDTGGAQGGSVFIARVLAVSGITIALWESFLSAFPMELEKARLYGFLILFSVLCVWIAGKRGIQGALYLFGAAACTAGVAWNNKIVCMSVVNRLANAVLNVKDAGKDPLFLYDEPEISGLMLAIGLAVTAGPLLIIFAKALIRGHGKILVLFLLLAPMIAAVLCGTFPSMKSCGLLVLTSGIYYAMYTGNTGRAIWGNGAAAGIVLTVLCILAWGVGGEIESRKTQDNGLYLKAQSLVREQVVQRLKSLTNSEEDGDKQSEQEKKEQESEENPEQKLEEQIQPEQEMRAADTIVENPGIDAEIRGDTDLPQGLFTELFSGGNTSSLKNIASFKPGDGEGLEVNLKEKPESTYYLPLEYGKTYDNSTWEMIKEGDDPSLYGAIPENLTRLLELCREQIIYRVDDAAAFIQTEFEENTVYDYHPGAVPGNQDFAEYFLFENQKGFCVHFATTATLMYRMLGCTSRYVEGYAIPSSAFIRQEDGSYKAEVTGEMGHAWCEVWEGTWVTREHTLPYTGTDQDAVPPAYENSGTNQRQSMGIVLRILLIVGILLLVPGVFLVQAAVRRHIRVLRCRRSSPSQGILSVYLLLCDMAVMLGKEIKEPLSAADFRKAKSAIPEIADSDWDWIQGLVWETVYGKKQPSKAEHKRVCELWEKAARSIWREMSIGKKIKYRYIKGLP